MGLFVWIFGKIDEICLLLLVMPIITTLTVLDKCIWSPNLFSFKTTRPQGFRFEAGQFVRLGVNPSMLKNTANAPDEQIFRAYSIVSSPYDEYLEFFSVVVPHGAFTSKLQFLDKGDTLYLENEPYGYLTLARFQEPAPSDLWLLATGTGVAPFLSMLKDLSTWEAYRHIVLVYSVRTLSELAYIEQIQCLAQDFGALADKPAQFYFVPIVTREQIDGAMNARLPTVLQHGDLEREVGLKLDTNTSHVMLCGNPQMVEDTKEMLKTMGLTMNRRGVGNIAVENYW